MNFNYKQYRAFRPAGCTIWHIEVRGRDLMEEAWVVEVLSHNGQAEKFVSKEEALDYIEDMKARDADQGEYTEWQ
jgi:hypothetical protein